MAKTDENAGALGVLFLLALGGYALYAIDWNFTGNQITDYALECSSYDSTGSCNGPYVQGPVTTYTVHADQQVVVSQVQGQAPTKLSKCAVVDRKNWKCNTASDNDYLSVAFTDGDIQDFLAGRTYKHVARYEWLWADKPKK